MKQYSTYSYDPLIGAEIMSLMGLDPAKLDIPRIAAQVHTVIKYFADRPDRRTHILKVMMKPGEKLDNLWTYVQLQKEKTLQLAVLDPNDFEPDVASEIVSGHITIDKKNRIKDSIKQHQERERQKEQLRQERRTETIEKKQVKEALPKEKLDLYSQTLSALDAIDNKLSIY